MARSRHTRRHPARRAAPRGAVRGAAWLALALLAGAACGAARAAPAEPGIAIHTVLGFSDTFRPGRWTPVTVTVGNHGPALSGHLEVVTRAGDEFRGQDYTVTHRRRLDLSRDARKRFHFTVLLDGLARPLVVRVVSAGEVLARQAIDLRQRYTAERLILVLGRDADLDYLNDREGKALRVLYPHPELLPDHWRGYDAVAAVVLHGVSLEALSARQYEALRRWLASGGTLAVSGGPDYSMLRTPRLAALLPATPLGMTALADPAAAGAALGVRLPAGHAIHVNRVGRVRGTVRMAADGVPLLLEQALGDGKVLYLTFDVARQPFARLPDMRDAWARMLALAPPDPRRTRAAQHDSPVPAIVGALGRDFPGHGTALLFLALYLAVLLAGLHMPAPRGRGRWLAPLATWAAPALFAPAAWLVFGPLLSERGASVALAAVIEPLGASRYAQVRLDLGLYERRDRALALEYDGIEPALQAPPASRFAGAPANDWVFGEDARRTAAPAGAHGFVLHLLEGRDVIPFDLEASLARRAGGLHLSVRNDSGHALEDAWLIWRGRAWPLGAVAGDARAEHPLAAEPLAVHSTRDEWWDVLERHPGGTGSGFALIGPVLAREAARLDAGEFPGHGQALLVARTASPLRPAGASAHWRQHAVALVLLRFSTPAEVDGGDPEFGVHVEN